MSSFQDVINIKEINEIFLHLYFPMKPPKPHVHSTFKANPNLDNTLSKWLVATL